MNCKKEILSTANAGIPRRVLIAITSFVLTVPLLASCASLKPGNIKGCAEPFNILVTNKAGSGTYETLAGGGQRLKLHEVEASINYAAEKEECGSGVTTVRTFIDQYDWDKANPPKAAVVVTDPAVPSNQNTVIVKLINPVYDERNATLSFDLQPESNHPGKNLAPYVADADTSLPATFGGVTLMVDAIMGSCKDGYITCYRHYGCCSQPFVTQPVGKVKVPKCYSPPWSCKPCHDHDCAKKYPNECGGGNCYTSCLNESECNP